MASELGQYRSGAELPIPIKSEADVVNARQAGRELADELGFGPTDQVLIATAISELARNILKYAGSGEVRILSERKRGRPGIQVIASDHGPGIANLEEALRDGWSTSGGLGLGLPGARRLMDDFDIETGPEGTVVTAFKVLTDG